ncbi:11287_t:CDS:2 [Diversispora eburnea]|uniref:11287_t:CDS:1 n=1 Tax=Diversispora eburnea TaxID=1213867 RepID=A0A9N8WA58_9GLOM|nr:11287_t:CDS:2 [Diversispora eburnea]
MKVMEFFPPYEEQGQFVDLITLPKSSDFLARLQKFTFSFTSQLSKRIQDIEILDVLDNEGLVALINAQTNLYDIKLIEGTSEIPKVILALSKKSDTLRKVYITGYSATTSVDSFFQQPPNFENLEELSLIQFSTRNKPLYHYPDFLVHRTRLVQFLQQTAQQAQQRYQQLQQQQQNLQQQIQQHQIALQQQQVYLQQTMRIQSHNPRASTQLQTALQQLQQTNQQQLQQTSQQLLTQQQQLNQQLQQLQQLINQQQTTNQQQTIQTTQTVQTTQPINQQQQQSTQTITYRTKSSDETCNFSTNHRTSNSTISFNATNTSTTSSRSIITFTTNERQLFYQNLQDYNQQLSSLNPNLNDLNYSNLRKLEIELYNGQYIQQYISLILNVNGNLMEELVIKLFNTYDSDNYPILFTTIIENCPKLKRIDLIVSNDSILQIPQLFSNCMKLESVNLDTVKIEPWDISEILYNLGDIVPMKLKNLSLGEFSWKYSDDALYYFFNCCDERLEFKPLQFGVGHLLEDRVLKVFYEFISNGVIEV